MSDRLVSFEVTDQVGVVTLDSHPNRNALSRALMTQLIETVAEAEADASVRAILLRSEGSAFCSGLDLGEALGSGMRASTELLVQVQRALVVAAKPVVVRVHGPVRAGGPGLLAAGDVSICADHVTFAFSEVRLGLSPVAVALTVLPRMNPRAASLAILTAEPFSAHDAARVGLITEAVPAEELDGRVATVLGLLTAGDSEGLRVSKQVLNAALLAGLDHGAATAAEQSAQLFDSERARQLIARRA